MKNNYNERSWAIDVISEINLYARNNNRIIRRAGGERTLKASTQGNSLFPDVLLFQDDAALSIVQGWELKMPDTSITDAELISNATKKAKLLRLDSFLVWNVTSAALYVLNDNEFTLRHEWNDLNDIVTRAEVEPNKERWTEQLHIIINDLNDFFTNGLIHTSSVIESFSANEIVNVILTNAGLARQNIDSAIQVDGQLSAEIDQWWENIKVEYSAEPNAQSALAKLILLTWINRFLFTHYLKQFAQKAFEVDEFNSETTVADASNYFEELTGENDFLNVFAPVLAENHIDQASWVQILQFNSFLTELRLENIDQALLQQFFEQILLLSKRKVAGQYATPYPLADYLSRIVMMDKTKTAMDSFCGTGTILRAMYDLKREYNVPAPNAISTLWGSDKFSFPLQMSTLSLAKPEVMGQVLNVFKSDIKDLEVGRNYEFIDPNTGQAINKPLPQPTYIISNLPFVEGSKIRNANPDIFNIVEAIRERLNDNNFKISQKSDLVAYLPHYMWDLLSNEGKIGLIISNSWLGTNWGEEFKDALNRFFSIDIIVTSGIGIWFNNAKVVTNLLVLSKRNEPVESPTDQEITKFVTLKTAIENLEDKAIARQCASQTLLQGGDLANINTLDQTQKNTLSSYGLNWSAFFADLSWFDDISQHLIPANNLFEINRGERRGWDEMFYPRDGHGIEAAYIQPVLENLRSVTTLIAETDGEAFCCSKTKQELEDEGSNGALAWIRRFEGGRNNKGRPLTESLARANHHWYEMKPDTMADLVGTINYGDRLFIAKMTERSFVNQRLIRFTSKVDTTDLDLCHALMNSVIGIFYIEALGFGRGQGALDLSSTKLRDSLHMLNPDALNEEQINEIKRSFTPLTQRDINKLPEEIELEDRVAFEETVARVYGFSNQWENIKAALLHLYNIRNSVKD